MCVYAIYVLRKSRRCRAVDGSWFRTSARVTYVHYSDSLAVAVSLAAHLKFLFGAPAFVCAEMGPPPVLRRA